MSVVDLKELIYNRKKCYDLYMIRESEPECQINLVNDINNNLEIINSYFI